MSSRASSATRRRCASSSPCSTTSPAATTLSFRETLRVLIEESILVRDNDTWVLRLRLGRRRAAAQDAGSAQRGPPRRARRFGLGGRQHPLPDRGADRRGAPGPPHRPAARTLPPHARAARGEGLILRSAITGASQVVLAHASVREAVRIRYEDSLSETRLELAERIAEQTTVDPQNSCSCALACSTPPPTASSTSASSGRPPRTCSPPASRAWPPRCSGGDHPPPQVRPGPRLAAPAQAPAQPRRARPGRSTTRAARPRSTRRHPRRRAARRPSGPGGVLARPRRPLHPRRRRRRRDGARSPADTPRSRPSRRATGSSSCGSPTAAPRSCSAPARSTARSAARRRRWRSSTSPTRRTTTSATSSAPACAACRSPDGWPRRAASTTRPSRSPPACRCCSARPTSPASPTSSVLGNEPERAIPETRAALEQLRAAGVTRMLINPLHNLGDLLLRSGDFEGASESFREALRFAGLHGCLPPPPQPRLPRLHAGPHGRGGGGRRDARRGPARHPDHPERAVRPPSAAPARRRSRAHARAEPGARHRARRDAAPISTRPIGSASRQWAQEALSRIERDRGTSFIETPTRGRRADRLPRPGHRAPTPC